MNRHTYIAPGKYRLDNPWGRVPAGGTQLCRFHELNDQLDLDVIQVLHVTALTIPGLIFTPRPNNVSSVQWGNDAIGAYAIGSGLCHEPTRPESTLEGFLWLHYLSEEPYIDERPFSISLPAYLARDAAYLVKLIIAAATAHHQSLQQRGLIPA